MPSIRLYCMTGGVLHFDQSVFTHMAGMGKRVKAPTPIFLIDHPKGKILFETGLHPKAAVDPASVWGEERALDWAAEFAADQVVDKQLASLGIKPEDIRFVIMSCLYPDHAGGMHLFPKAKFIVQYRELQDAWWPDRRLTKSYTYREMQPIRDLDFLELHDEDLDLFGDGSVEILFTPAHTRGEQSVVLRLPNTGTIVLPAGIMPQKANFELGIMTGTPAVDPSIAHRSMTRLKRIAERENATVIFHHDFDDWQNVRKVPDYYD
ncbi:glyoxylase-like metal-dependent hydrolase (beta-lactamase superfamily II) [Rhizobium petrolearium]|uniref:N-acyl homoserine lactonase family protein n=1 Tax=Neorhizobium petrolearium TaxID=515361 RepID=UPI001AE8A994|nr:N-acyl homoserine lactonase family protein [Neorhizobium petrolearium]MBP1848142.1 glyoxylase-like metal-dependent hydrolase (beta-lactamase superfamily II) [Neorhizobium petrolearium]